MKRCWPAIGVLVGFVGCARLIDADFDAARPLTSGTCSMSEGGEGGKVTAGGEASSTAKNASGADSDEVH